MQGRATTVALLTAGLVAAGCQPAEPDPRDESAEPPAEEPQESEEPDESAAAPLVEDEPEPVPLEPHRAAPLPTPRTEVTGAAWDGLIVGVGGLDAAGGAVAAVDLYDPDDDAWSSGPDLPVALHHTAVETLDGRLYVVGGYAIEGGAWVAEDAVWSLGPGEGEWRQEPPLATPRGALAVASTGDRLVAIGGVGPGREVLASTEVLASDADAWVPGPTMATAREHLDATAAGDAVYAISGRAGGLDTNHATVEVLVDGEWQAAPDVFHPRGGIGADTVGEEPCVAGGEEPGTTIAEVECLIDGTWEVVAELEVARHGLVVAARGGLLHIVGGGPEPGLTVSDVHEVVPVGRP